MKIDSGEQKFQPEGEPKKVRLLSIETFKRLLTVFDANSDGKVSTEEVSNGLQLSNALSGAQKNGAFSNLTPEKLQEIISSNKDLNGNFSIEDLQNFIADYEAEFAEQNELPDVPLKIDIKNFSIEEIKKIFNDKDVEVTETFNEEIKRKIISVFDKDGEPVARYESNNDEVYTISDNYNNITAAFERLRFYNQSGHLFRYTEGGNWHDVSVDSGVIIDDVDMASAYEPSPTLRTKKARRRRQTSSGNAVQIADNIYNDISKKDFGIIPTTNVKGLKKHVAQINAGNVLEVLNKYQKRHGQSLLRAIFNEIGMDASTRAEVVKHIMLEVCNLYRSKGVYVDDVVSTVLKEIKYQKNKIGMMDSTILNRLIRKLGDRYKEKTEGRQNNYGPDGKVNKPALQGSHTGDCYLLATINSMTYSPKGRDILNRSVKLNRDGSVTVHLQGVNKTYTFSRAELLGATEYVTGDLDVRAIEMAVDKYFMEEEHDRVLDDGGRGIDAFKILIGKNHLDLYGWDQRYDEIIGVFDTYKKKINDPNTICTVGYHPTITGSRANSEKVIYTTPDGDKIYSNHEYSVVKVENNYVYLINPWNSSKLIRMPWDSFKKVFNCYSDVTL